MFILCAPPPWYVDSGPYFVWLYFSKGLKRNAWFKKMDISPVKP